ncbi:hypothetical protein Palpr_2116 [Paludibacter propionicigenes WB4]|uniref:Fibronectin type-III domain-containing protein n=1 Tax=Paludibacter propionicigenes (strain DSM 17365 / JCM 13257 / WB4) TaxID=694427 RepID=E4T6A8_PALPW|nr:leucine-rich repeat domain-containing protein [Paludibacter propionicigenes]ADQ80252.1 hypothetical protein Palpr_2116 [Paludibacter propionicigenes WB4]
MSKLFFIVHSKVIAVSDVQSLSVLTTTVATSITKTTAVTGGNITDQGSSAVTARGVCWSTSLNPTIVDAKTTDADGTGAFSSSITGLTSGVTYHIRAYATNDTGTAYGADLTFTTLGTEPTVTTTTASVITKTTATAGGEVTSAGTSPVTARGVCWSTSANPTITDNKTTDADGAGVFSSSITGLTSGVTYHVRAYATSAVGTSYGADLTFTTLGTEPTVTTTIATAITKTTATAGGEVTSAGTSPVTARGVCWSTSANPTIADNKTTDADGAGVFSSSITGLTSAITYHVRAYATSAVGTSYGADLTFTALGTEPTVTTTIATAITKTTATAGGEVTSAGTSPVTSRGVCWSTSASPTIADAKTTDADGAGTFTSAITSLTSGVTYHIRAYATSAVGTSYGADLTFETLGTLPTVTTTAASFVTSTTATAGGEVTSAGTSPIITRGVCWSLNANPILANANSLGSGSDKYICSITGLKSNTTYHIRAYATSAVGTAYGEDLTLTTIIADPTITVNVPTAGTLNTLISTGDKTSITNLTLTGTIDARDVKFLRDELVNLEVLDIIAVNITAYSGGDGTINSSIDYPANELPKSSFCFTDGTGKAHLKSINLPNSITSIGSMAFQNCTGLTNIIIPNSVTSIGSSSFWGCSNINNLMLGTSVTSIGNAALFMCSKLTTVTLPASLSTIGSESFGNEWAVKEYIVDSNNQNFSYVDGVLFNKDKTTLILFPKNANTTTYAIPVTVSTIGDKAFQYSSVTSVSIPASLTTIVENAFGNCRSLTEFVVDPGNMNFSTLNGCLFNKNQSALIISPAGKKGNYTIPNTVTSIRNYAFSGSTSLTSVVIGSSVSSIGSGAFVDCWNLASISSARAIPLSLANPFAFGGMNNTKWTLYVPVGSKTDYLAADQWKDVPKIVEGFPAIVETDNASSITATTIVTGGNVSTEGTSAVTARGVCWSFDAFPTIAGSKTTDGAGLGTFTSNISNLSPGQVYHVRAYATSDVGTAYGTDLTFTTVGTPPTVSTTEASSITKTTAISGGNITSFGTSSIIASGVCWSTNANPTIADNKTTDGTGFGVFTSSISGLSSGVTYHYRAYATNNSGTSYGSDKIFSTLGTLPAVSTRSAASISTTSATVGGNVTNQGSSSVTYRGICWSRTINPTTADNITTDGTGAGIFSSSITGLTPGVTYHFRAYATNSVGTVYGDDLTFVTVTTGLSDEKISSITLYPNPAIDELQIKNLDGVAIFTLSDLSGRQLINKKIANDELVSVSTLPKGIYIVRVTTKDGTIEKKIVKD